MRRDGSSFLPLCDGQHLERVADRSQSNTRLLAWLQVHFSKLLYTYDEQEHHEAESLPSRCRSATSLLI